MLIGRLLSPIAKRARELRDRLPRRLKYVFDLLVIVAYLGLGVAVTCAFEEQECVTPEAIAAHDPLSKKPCVEPLSFVDGLYFAVVTISTVGYGDFSPTSTGMKIFVVLYIIIGVSQIFVMLSDIFVNVLEWYRQGVLWIIDKFDRTAKTVGLDTVGDGIEDSIMRVSGRSKGLSGRGVDLSGDGKVDFIAPPEGLVFWSQELLPAMTLWLLLQLVSAAVFMACQSNLDYGTAFYHCLITATTVGYGDVSLETTAARAWASFHILVSVSWLAALIGTIEDLRHKRHAQLARAVLLTKPLDREEVLKLDQGGQGIDKLEFVIGMLQMLGVKLCDEELKWDDVMPFLKKFDELDVSKTGKIDRDDLDKFYKQDRKEQAQRIKDAGFTDEHIARAQSFHMQQMLKHGDTKARNLAGDTKPRAWALAREGTIGLPQETSLMRRAVSQARQATRVVPVTRSRSSSPDPVASKSDEKPAE